MNDRPVDNDYPVWTELSRESFVLESDGLLVSADEWLNRLEVNLFTPEFER